MCYNSYIMKKKNCFKTDLIVLLRLLLDILVFDSSTKKEIVEIIQTSKIVTYFIYAFNICILFKQMNIYAAINAFSGSQNMFSVKVVLLDNDCKNRVQ